MDKDQMLGFQNGGQRSQPGPLPWKSPPQVLTQPGQILQLFKAALPSHLPESGFGVLGQIDGKKVLIQLVCFKEAVDQTVAVAAQGIDGVGTGQLHKMAQQSQTVLPFFQHIPHQHQDILRGQPDLVH